MKVWLVMPVERDAKGRFGGGVSQVGQGTLVGFSGTLAMLKVLEDLVARERLGDDGAEGSGACAGAGSPVERAGG